MTTGCRAVSLSSVGDPRSVVLLLGGGSVSSLERALQERVCINLGTAAAARTCCYAERRVVCTAHRNSSGAPSTAVGVLADRAMFDYVVGVCSFDQCVVRSSTYVICVYSCVTPFYRPPGSLSSSCGVRAPRQVPAFRLRSSVLYVTSRCGQSRRSG